VADLSEAQVKSAAIARASRVVVLMDSDKFGVRDFAAVCEVSQVHAIVTDSAAAPAVLDLGDRVQVITA
jgi:DeoR family transcriptional regulator of aga operon